MSGLQVVDVHKTYRAGEDAVPVLRGVTFDVPRGQSAAIVGPSGSGKSTLLHIIGALDRADSGRVEIDGTEPQSLSEPDLARFRNGRVGFVFQDHYLLPQYSVLENVLLPTLAFGSAPGDATERARGLLDRVGLGHRLDHRPAQISGGERQRAAVARALINQPGLLLCDEPTGSLDGATADAVAGLLFDLHAEAGNVLVVVTHSTELAGRCGKTLRLQDGRCSGA